MQNARVHVAGKKMIISSYTFPWSVSDVNINKILQLFLLYCEVYSQYKSISITILMNILMNNG